MIKNRTVMMLSGIIAAACTVPAVVAGAKGEVVAIDNGLKSRAPAHWVKKPVTSRFRAFQFAVPPAKGDKVGAEIVIFFFGKGGGGGLEANLKRWKTKFEPGAGKKVVSKVAKWEVGKSTAHVLDLQGTYLDRFPPFDPNAKLQRKKDYRQFAVYFASPNGPYFIRMTGPARTMAANQKQFESWIKGFK